MRPAASSCSHGLGPVMVPTSLAFSGTARDRKEFGEMLDKTAQLLAQSQTRFSATITYLTTSCGWPKTPARLSSLPPPVVEDLYRRLVADDFGLRLAKQSAAGVKGSGRATKATAAALDTLLNPDAEVLFLLQSGSIEMKLPWWAVLWHVLPFSALAMAAVAKHHRPGASPTFTQFAAEVRTISLKCKSTGAPSLAHLHSRLRWFIAETTALEIKYPPRRSS